MKPLKYSQFFYNQRTFSAVEAIEGMLFANNYHSSSSSILK